MESINQQYIGASLVLARHFFPSPPRHLRFVQQCLGASADTLVSNMSSPVTYTGDQFIPKQFIQKTMPTPSTENAVHQLAHALRVRRWRLAVAESCTGGLIAAACTDVAGSSAWFESGYVTYSAAAKQRTLSVPAALIARRGIVSEAVALVMARGALAHSGAHCAVSTTGIAGPTGGSAAQPVGTVCFGWCAADGAEGAETCRFTGDRAAVRAQATRHALALMRQRVEFPGYQFVTRKHCR